MRAKIAAGNKYGKLTVIGRDRSKDRTYWICQCECGEVKSIYSSHLTGGKIKSCRQCHATVDDLTGLRFGRLVVNSLSQVKNGRSYWTCTCDCGAIKVILGQCLKNGDTQSCGCQKKENVSRAHKTHGFTDRPGWSSYRFMVNRCTKKDSIGYDRYGGAGISVCKRWMESFENFIEDMKEPPQAGLTIDRIENLRGYDCGHCDDCVARNAPPNCRWATRIEQANNKSNNVFLEHNNQRHTIAEWSRITGISASTIHSRLLQGWSVDLALS